MKFLFDSKGKNIANEVNGRLHSTSGKNIGHFVTPQNIFIDMKGYYLGEVISGNRLMYRINSPYKNICFGSYGNVGSVGNFGNPGNNGSIGVISGFKDLEIA